MNGTRVKRKLITEYGKLTKANLPGVYFLLTGGLEHSILVLNYQELKQRIKSSGLLELNLERES